MLSSCARRVIIKENEKRTVTDHGTIEVPEDEYEDLVSECGLCDLILGDCQIALEAERRKP